MNMKLTKRIVWACLAIGVLLAGAAGVFAFSLGKYEKVNATGPVVALPVTGLSDGKAHFYKFTDSGKEIAFFVVKGPDGAFRTAFDACDVCYREKKGYEQRADAMVCKNCNQKFAINRIGPHEAGGCNPSYLPHQLRGATITINVADLKAGARFF